MDDETVVYFELHVRVTNRFRAHAAVPAARRTAEASFRGRTRKPANEEESEHALPNR
jgi:hypothetical protein